MHTLPPGPTFSVGKFALRSSMPIDAFHCTSTKIRALLLSLAGIGGSAIVEVLNYSKF